MRYDVKGADGAVRLRVQHGPGLDDVRLTKQINDDQVVDLVLDAAELRGLEVVVAAIAKVRAEQAATPATKAGAAALAIAAVVAGGCLQGGNPSAGAFLVTYADRTTAVVDEGDGRGKCELPRPERLQLEQLRAECTYVPRAQTGLNLLCGLGQGRWLPTFRWDDHGEGGRGVLHIEAPSCFGDYDVEIHRRAE